MLLPSHPVVALSFAHRRPQGPEATQGTFFNWYVALSQEIEIAGQRGARLELADAEMAAQVRRVAVAEQEAAAAALSAYYELIAAREALRLAAALGSIADSLARLASGRVAQALSAPVDADVAVAEATRLGLMRIEAAQQLRGAHLELMTLLGIDPLRQTEVSGAWPPVLPATGMAEMGEAALVERALALRGEVGAAEMEQRARERQVRLLRRARVPNLTLSFIAQRDGLDELVLGGGLQMPLYLPAPLGPGRRGEITEAVARVEQATTSIEQVRRRVRLEVTQATATERAKTESLALFSPALVQRAEADLHALAQAVAAQRMPLREALLQQRSLIELLSSHVRVRLEAALARVELLRATGLLGQEVYR
ncbi:MAG: TolC family protein [Myxococcales bacterium]|nr:TolC family protein [Myxococcales bacterium]